MKEPKDCGNKVLKELSSDNYATCTTSDARSAKDCHSNYTKSELQSNSKSQMMNSRLQSLDDSVEVQEYLREEEIEDATNKTVSNVAGTNRVEGKSTAAHDLQQGRRILTEILSDSYKNINWPFVNPVDSSLEGCQDYYERIQKPVWLKKMEEKFAAKQYKSIIEFVSDMRLMVDNCFLFNGLKHSISKKAQKLETILNQKITLLSRDLREMINDSVAPRNSVVVLDDADSVQFRSGKKGKDSRRRLREQQRQRMIERKIVFDHFVNTLQTWDENLFDDVTRIHMRAMWELPQIGLFLFLCSRPLNLNISQYELERCFFLSRQSTALRRLMTSLFSSANQRSKIHPDGLMHRKVWEEKMKDYISPWFRQLAECSYDTAMVSEKFAIDERFFKVLGLTNPLDVTSYHDLTYYKKVWIVKSVCDHLLDIQKSLLDSIEKQDLIDLRPRDLGVDWDGNTYFYFSQFCGDDVRIYRHAPLPNVEIGPIDTYDTEPRHVKKKGKAQPKKRPSKVCVMDLGDDQKTPRTRDSRLRQNPKQMKSYQVEHSDTSSSEEGDVSEEENVSENGSSLMGKSSNVDDGASTQGKSSSVEDGQNKEDGSVADKKSECAALKKRKSSRCVTNASEKTKDSNRSLPNGWTDVPVLRRSERKIIEESIKNAVPENKSKSSKCQYGNDEKLQRKRINRNDWKALAPFLPERNLRSKRVVEPSVDDSRKLDGSDAFPERGLKKPKCEDVIEASEELNVPEIEDSKVDEGLSAPSETVSLGSTEVPDIKDDEELSDDMKEECQDKEDVGMLEDDAEIKVESQLNFEPTALGPDLEEFELVAENIQDIRDLITKIQAKVENANEQAGQTKVLNKKSCGKLLENLDYLLKDLEPHEGKLAQALKKSRMQMRKEQDAYKEEPEPAEEPWENNEETLATSGRDPSVVNSLCDDSSDAIQATESHSQEEVEVKKKNIFENDIDMALVLSQGRVLRKRNNVQPQPAHVPTKRSKRLLNKPSRYKDEDYLLDDSIMDTACNENAVTSALKRPETSLTPQPSSSSESIHVQQLTQDTANRKHFEIGSYLPYSSSTQVIGAPSMSSVPNSMVNMNRLNTISMNDMNLQTSQLLESLVPTMLQKSSSLHNLIVMPTSSTETSSTNLTFLAVKSPERAVYSTGNFLPTKATPVSTSPLSVPHLVKSSSLPHNSLSILPSSQKPVGMKLNSLQASFSPAIVLNNPQANISLVNIPSSNGMAPNFIIVPKNLSLSQSSVQRKGPTAQPVRQATPSMISNRPPLHAPGQACSPASNMVINIQNILPIPVSIQTGTQTNNSSCIRPLSSSNLAINSNAPIIHNARAVNVSSLSPASRTFVPLKSQPSGNPTAAHSQQANESSAKLAGLVSFLNANPALSLGKLQGNSTIGQLPLQMGRVNSENGQPVLVLANSLQTQMPPKLQRNVLNSSQLPAVASSTNKSYSSGLQIQNQSINTAMVQLLNGLSNSNVAHQLISPGLIPVSYNQSSSIQSVAISNSPPTINLATPTRGLVNIPILLNKDMLRVLSQPQKPIQLNQVTSQGH